MPWPTTYPFFHVDQPEQVDNAALLRRLQRPEGPVDVVLDTDTYNEIDDQYALAYLIKNDEKLKLKAIYAAPFCNNKAATPAIGMQKSYDEIKNILSLMGRMDLLDCTYRGSESYLPDEKTPVESDAARHLAQLAMQYTLEKPLYVIAIAAITNVASALLMKPEIRDRIVLVWLGGNALHWHDLLAGLIAGYHLRHRDGGELLNVVRLGVARCGGAGHYLGTHGNRCLHHIQSSRYCRFNR